MGIFLKIFNYSIMSSVYHKLKKISVDNFIYQGPTLKGLDIGEKGDLSLLIFLLKYYG